MQHYTAGECHKAASSSERRKCAYVVQMKTQIETLKGTKETAGVQQKFLWWPDYSRRNSSNAAKSSMNIVDRSQALSQGQALEDMKKQSTSEQLANVGGKQVENWHYPTTLSRPPSPVQSRAREAGVNGIAGSSNPGTPLPMKNMMTVTFRSAKSEKYTDHGAGSDRERGNHHMPAASLKSVCGSESADRPVPDQGSGKCQWQRSAKRCIREADY